MYQPEEDEENQLRTLIVGFHIRRNFLYWFVGDDGTYERVERHLSRHDSYPVLENLWFVRTKKSPLELQEELTRESPTIRKLVVVEAAFPFSVSFSKSEEEPYKSLDSPDFAQEDLKAQDLKEAARKQALLDFKNFSAEEIIAGVRQNKYEAKIISLVKLEILERLEIVLEKGVELVQNRFLAMGRDFDVEGTFEELEKALKQVGLYSYTGLVTHTMYPTLKIEIINQSSIEYRLDDNFEDNHANGQISPSEIDDVELYLKRLQETLKELF